MGTTLRIRNRQPWPQSIAVAPCALRIGGQVRANEMTTDSDEFREFD